MKGKIGSMTLATAGLSTLAMAQSTPVDHLSQAQLLDKVPVLKSQAAKGNGSASVKLADYPNHATMLTYRTTSGGGEIHEHFADIFYVVAGSATLVTGGTLADQSTAGAGEFRGSAVTGKTETVLQAGDIVHIPAGTAHQLLVSAGQEFVYFVVKVHE